MGIYINPPEGTKESWLREHSIETSYQSPLEPSKDDNTWVCLIDNPMFSAAGIMYNDGELKEFTNPNDPRPKLWILIPTKDLIEVTRVDFTKYNN